MIFFKAPTPTTPTTTLRTTQRTTTNELTTSPPVPSTTEQEETSPSTTTTSVVQTTADASSEAPSLSATSDATDDLEYNEENTRPRVDKRLPKLAATAGKAFSVKVDENVFYDEEDKTKLELELLDKNAQQIPAASWIRYNKETREIYGLPLESDVSKYEFKLRATDSVGEYVDETVEITVQQYKGYRSANHEIYIQVKLEKNYESPVDWEIRLIRGIVEALDDDSIGSVVVREVKQNKYEVNMFTFIYTNETLPKDHCPKDELASLMERLTKPALNEAMKREITVRNVEKDLVGSCQERVKAHVITTNTKNFPPTVRNPIDRIVANVGQLLVSEVPKDTFYDPEDLTDLKLTLLNEDRSKLDPNHWLQFDNRNREFFGVPSPNSKHEQQYILVAEDKNGLITNDALVVEVNSKNFKRDLSATFDYQLDMNVEQFNNPSTKRKFIEAVARVFKDADTSNIIMKMAKKQYAGRTSVMLQNITLHQPICPHTEIEKLRNILVRQDGSVRDEVKETIGTEFNVLRIHVAPAGK